MANTFFSDAAEFDSTAVVVEAKPSAGIGGLFKALANRMYLLQQRRADAEVGEFIEQHGGQLTDDLERQISRRFGSPSGTW